MSKWEKVKLGEVATYINGFAFKPSDWCETGLPIIRIQNLTNSSKEINYYDKSYNPKYEVNKGDILISWSASLGVYEWKKGKALLNQHIFKVVFDKLDIDKKFFVYSIQTLLTQMAEETHGATMKHITKPKFDNMPFSLPPLEEQKRIADILDKAVNLIDLRKQQLEKMDLLIKSKFIDMFGDPVTNPKGWEIEKLGKHISVIGGYAFKSNGFSAHGIPVLRIGNINSGFFKSSNLVFWNEDKMLARYLLKPGDMVISLTGTVGKDDYGNVCILSNDYSQYYLNQRNAKLEIRNTIEKQYLSNILKIPKIKNELTDISRGVRQANISNADILNLCIPVPPIELQNQFSEFVEKVEKQKAVMQQSLEKMETNYKALMQKYFG